MEESAFIIPKYLDAPVQLLGVSPKEISLVFIPFLLGCAFGFSFQGICLGVALLYGYMTFKSRAGEAALKRLLYWYFPGTLVKLRSTPSSVIREYIG